MVLSVAQAYFKTAFNNRSIVEGGILSPLIVNDKFTFHNLHHKNAENFC